MHRWSEGCLQSSEKELFDLLAACVGEPSILADNRESTFPQDPQGGDIVFGSPRIEGALLDVTEKRQERTGRDAFAPVLLAKPVADLSGL
jgi:hypothetical protein